MKVCHAADALGGCGESRGTPSRDIVNTGQGIQFSVDEIVQLPKIERAISMA